MTRRRHNLARGYALPAVMLFLLFAFGLWAVFFRGSGALLRVEQARVLRESRTTWSAPGVATALRLLQTGDPPRDPYTCKLSLTQDSETRYVLLTFTKIGPARWTTNCTRTDASDPTIDAPATFFTVPATPTGLLATASSSSQINLAWNDVKFDNGYIIQRSPNGTSSWSQIATTAKNVTSYSDTGLSTYTGYYYRVCATNSAGNSGWSNTSNATTFDVLPANPTALAAVAVSASQINLTWTDNATNETNYLIERSPNGSSSWAQIAIAAANATSYSNTGLAANTAYYYRVRATNAIGNSGYTNTANAATWTTVPSTPGGLTAVATSNTQINLAWTDVANETGYKIERSANGTTGWAQIATTAPNVVTYSNTGLAASTAYYYRVCAYNGSGNSAYSNTANATTTNGVPPAPSGLTAVASSYSQIDLSWTDNATNETGFKIERSTNGTTWTQIGTTTTDVTTYSSTGLTASTLYYYRVRANNATGNSGYGNTATATTQTNVPANPSALSAVAVSYSQINLSWTDNSNIETGFKIERSPDGSTGWTQIATTAVNVTTYSNTGLTASTPYYYRVRANNGAVNSGYSNTAHDTTQTNIPADPSALSATVVSYSQIDLSWTDNSNIETGFKIERSPDGVTWTQIGTTLTNVTTYSSTALTGSTLYYYRVRANNGAVNSGYSNTVNATTLTPIPADPSGLAASAASSSTINLTWTDNSTIETGFKIERSTTGTSGWAQIGTTAANVTSYSDSTGLPSTTYYYRVRANNGANNSGYTANASATTAAHLPADPSNLSLTIASATSVTVNWTDNATDEIGYKVERSTNGTTWTLVKTLGVNVVTWTNTGLTTNTRYYYRVCSYNASGNSGYSNTANIVPN